MAGATVVTGGTYLLELSTGFDSSAFYLDDSLLNGTQVLDGDGNDFVDITNLAENISVSRGRKQTLDPFGPGRMTVTISLDKTERQLDAFNTASIYYNLLTEEPGLAPLRPIRLSRNGTYIFTGRITNYDQTYTIDGLTTYNIAAADDIYTLSQGFLPETATSAQTSAARASAVLTAAAYTGTTSITAAPVATLGAFTIASGTNVNTYLNRVQQAEQGRIFCSRTNVLTMQPRIGTTVVQPVAALSDTGANIKYNALQVEFDQQKVINNCSITIESGGAIQTASNAASIAQYFKQTFAITDSLLSTNAQAATLADYLLYPIPQPRFTAVSSYFASLTDAQKTTMTPIEIGDTITVTKTFTTGVPLTVTQFLSVEGIDHSINVFQGHSMTLYTSQTQVYDTFILDDITFGILDSTNALG
jgi:hypothetical protein